jgi:hypothetical protein
MDKKLSIGHYALHGIEPMKKQITPKDKSSSSDFPIWASRHPWRSFGIMFLYFLGAVHLCRDVFSYIFPSIHSHRWDEYEMALIISVVMVGLLKYTTSHPKLTQEQRELEEQTLRQADEILKQAQADVAKHAS